MSKVHCFNSALVSVSHSITFNEYLLKNDNVDTIKNKMEPFAFWILHFRSRKQIENGGWGEIIMQRSKQDNFKHNQMLW
jgi:tRNA(His) 5'-end guanylyltransferase